MSKRKPRAGARRRPHKKTEEPDDLFVAKVIEVTEWSRHNSRLLTILAIVVVILAAGGVYYMKYRKGHTQQAAQSLEEVYQSLSIQDNEGARQELVTFLARFDNTPYAGEARMLLGQIYLDGSQPQQAIAVLEPLAKSPRTPLELQAATLLGAAYEQDGRAQDAEALYLTIADRSDLGFQVNESLDRAARIRTAQGDNKGAAELYQRILDRLDENDQQRGLYEMRLHEVEAAQSAHT